MSARIYPSFGILLVDDEPAWLDSLSMSLERTAGVNNIEVCQNGTLVLDILSQGKIGLVLLDLTMPDCTGQDILKKIGEQFPEVRVIILTGLNQIETAVECMKSGAHDYFVKTDEHLITSIIHAVETIELLHENKAISHRLLNDSLEHPHFFAGIISCSKSMRSIFQYIEATAKSIQPMLVTGESGTGKELITKAIHDCSGRQGNLVCVNVAGYDDQMFADALFGHVKGAFTGADTLRNGLIEEATQGTLFLDEIGDLSAVSQVKLLRLLNNGEYFPLGGDKAKRSSARIVVATNQDLPSLMASGKFRKDLYFRLQIHRIHIPPLRKRPNDIGILLDHFISEASAELGKIKPAFPKELPDLLKNYIFPGNVREFRSMVFDAVAQHKSGILSMRSFLAVTGHHDVNININEDGASITGSYLSELAQLPTMDQAEDILIAEAMRRAGGNQSMAARFLGMTQSALSKRIKRHKQKQ
jgi:DNA-binding NtrC family response regulator